MLTSAPNPKYWNGIAIDSTGTKLAAVESDTGIYISTSGLSCTIIISSIIIIDRWECMDKYKT